MVRTKLVLLPGIDGSGLLFQPLLQALAPDIEPIVIAYPEHELLGYDELLPRVLKALPANEPFVLLGESFGGPLALRVAQMTASNLCGLILSASFVTCPFAGMPKLATHLVTPHPFSLLPHYSRIKKMLGLYSSPALAELSLQALSSASPAVWAHRLREVIRVDVCDMLANLCQPMLYLQGAHDLIVPAHNLRHIRRIKPAVHSVRLAAPHMVLQTQPVLAARAIENFISSQCNPMTKAS